MTTAKFIPDSKIPKVEEVDMGDGIKQLVIRYKDEDVEEEKRDLKVIPFLPAMQRTVTVEPVKKAFPWHDFMVYAITLAPILFTLMFAQPLMKAGAFLLMGFASVAWFSFVFLVNTKFHK